MRYGREPGVIAPVILVGLIAASMACHAADIENVTVTATRVERSLKDVPATVSVISAEEVEKKPEPGYS